MPLVIVRHASAGSKAAWAGDDLARPLDRGGVAAARALAGLFARVAPAARVISSPATRCMQTVAPFAARSRRRVEQAPALAPGADQAGVAELVARVAGAGPAVVCVHRENLPAAVRAACAAYGAHAPAQLAVPKGGYWVIHDGGRAFAERCGGSA